MTDNQNLSSTPGYVHWMYMVDYMTNGGNVHVADTMASWMASSAGQVSAGRTHNLLAKPIQ
jgi:hypothetical protein